MIIRQTPDRPSYDTSWTQSLYAREDDIKYKNIVNHRKVTIPKSNPVKLQTF